MGCFGGPQTPDLGPHIQTSYSLCTRPQMRPSDGPIPRDPDPWILLARKTWTPIVVGILLPTLLHRIPRRGITSEGKDLTSEGKDLTSEGKDLTSEDECLNRPHPHLMVCGKQAPWYVGPSCRLNRPSAMPARPMAGMGCPCRGDGHAAKAFCIPGALARGAEELVSCWLCHLTRHHAQHMGALH